MKKKADGRRKEGKLFCKKESRVFHDNECSRAELEPNHITLITLSKTNTCSPRWWAPSTMACAFNWIQAGWRSRRCVPQETGSRTSHILLVAVYQDVTTSYLHCVSGQKKLLLKCFICMVNYCLFRARPTFIPFQVGIHTSLIKVNARNELARHRKDSSLIASAIQIIFHSHLHAKFYRMFLCFSTARCTWTHKFSNFAHKPTRYFEKFFNFFFLFTVWWSFVGVSRLNIGKGLRDFNRIEKISSIHLSSPPRVYM